MIEINFEWFCKCLAETGNIVQVINSKRRPVLTAMMEKKSINFVVHRNMEGLKPADRLLIVDESGLWDEDQWGEPSSNWIIISGIMMTKIMRDEKLAWNGKNVLRSMEFTGVLFKLVAPNDTVTRQLESHNGVVTEDWEEQSIVPNYFVATQLPEDVMYTERLVRLRNTDGYKILGREFIELMANPTSLQISRHHTSLALEHLLFYVPASGDRYHVQHQILDLGGNCLDNLVGGCIVLLREEELETMNPEEVLAFDPCVHMILGMDWLADTTQLGISNCLLDVSNYKVAYTIPHPASFPDLQKYRIAIMPTNVQDDEEEQLLPSQYYKVGQPAEVVSTLQKHGIFIEPNIERANVIIAGDLLRRKYAGKHVVRWDCLKMILEEGKSHECEWNHAPFTHSLEPLISFENLSLVSMLDEHKTSHLRSCISAFGGVLRDPTTIDNNQEELIISEKSFAITSDFFDATRKSKMVMPQLVKDLIEKGWVDVVDYVYAREEILKWRNEHKWSASTTPPQGSGAVTSGDARRFSGIDRMISFIDERDDNAPKHIMYRILLHIQNEMSALGLQTVHFGVDCTRPQPTKVPVITPSGWSKGKGVIKITPASSKEENVVLAGWYLPEEHNCTSWVAKAGELVCKLFGTFGMAASHVIDKKNPKTTSLVIVSAKPDKDPISFMTFEVGINQNNLPTCVFNVYEKSLDCFLDRIYPTFVAHPQAIIVCGTACVCGNRNNLQRSLLFEQRLPIRTFMVHGVSQQRELGCPLVVIANKGKHLFRIRLSKGSDGKISKLDYKALEKLCQKCDVILAKSSFSHLSCCPKCLVNYNKDDVYMPFSSCETDCCKCNIHTKNANVILKSIS